ncbi:MAG: hypothetical protein JW818_08580 [Pirellulales bacterium]|nr:hypothetical protein [Pirellulales bacterium]
MPTICCTSKLLAAIDDPPAETADTTSAGQAWYGHLFTIERRKGILFIHEKTLFVCLALAVRKSDYRQIVPFFQNLLGRTLRQEGFNEREAAWVLNQHQAMTIGRTKNRSTLGSLNNRIAEAKFLIEHLGGLDICDVVDLAHRLNETPMGPIGYSSGYEEMKRLVDGGWGDNG